jgi:hypothetical protein
MVNNEIKLSFSVKNNPGVFALLLGSGASTEAGVPTGWGVVQDLILKIANQNDTEIETTPEEWYEETFDEEAEYDNIIGQLTQSKEERRSLLEKYFEPTDLEREQGEKLPTEGHKHIAWLVEQGYINVIVTTNFDRLLERAFIDRELTPLIASSARDVREAEPLQHQDALILKVNGDYKDVNIKNVSDELGEYDDGVENLLSRVFSEYGLIICGWSARYDTALRQLLIDNATSRYPTYWAAYGSVSAEAQTVVDERDAMQIQTDGATSFFTNLTENVRALQSAEKEGPLTTEIARERIKRYLSKSEKNIALGDLFREETDRVYQRIFNEDRYQLDNEVERDTVYDRFESYEEELRILATAAATCAYWGPKGENNGRFALENTISRLGYPPSLESRHRHGVWVALRQRYPIAHFSYTVGIAGLEIGNWDAIRAVLLDAELENIRGDIVPFRQIHPWEIGSEFGDGGWGNRNLRSRLKSAARSPLSEYVPSDARFDKSADKFEAILDLLLLHDKDVDEDQRLPHFEQNYYQETLSAIDEELNARGEEWGPIQAGIFPNDVDRINAYLSNLESRFDPF